MTTYVSIFNLSFTTFCTHTWKLNRISFPVQSCSDASLHFSNHSSQARLNSTGYRFLSRAFPMHRCTSRTILFDSSSTYDADEAVRLKNFRWFRKLCRGLRLAPMATQAVPNFHYRWKELRENVWWCPSFWLTCAWRRAQSIMISPHHTWARDRARRRLQRKERFRRCDPLPNTCAYGLRTPLWVSSSCLLRLSVLRPEVLRQPPRHSAPG